MDKLICEKYAQALFELAKEQDKCLSLEDEAKAITAAMKDVEGFEKLLGHPDIEADKKMSVIKSAFPDLDKDLEGFISLVFTRGRGNILSDMLEMFIDLSRQERNVVDAYIVSAYDLTADKLDRLKGALEKKLGKTIEPHVSVDKSLIGGLKITVGGHMINSTIKSSLDNLTKLLKDNKTSEERRDAV